MKQITRKMIRAAAVVNRPGLYVIHSRIRGGPLRCGSSNFDIDEATRICATENRNDYGGVFWPAAAATALTHRRGRVHEAVRRLQESSASATGKMS